MMVLRMSARPLSGEEATRFQQTYTLGRSCPLWCDLDHTKSLFWKFGKTLLALKLRCWRRATGGPYAHDFESEGRSPTDKQGEVFLRNRDERTSVFGDGRRIAGR